MGYRYVILGAGRQGRAAAYDMAQWGDADTVTLADVSLPFAERSVERLRTLLPDRRALFIAKSVDVKNRGALVHLLRSAQVVMSAVPYPFNPEVTRAAIEARVHMCDLGGDTDAVQAQLKQDESARKAGVTIIPDCGLAPGMNNLFAAYGIEQLDRTESVEIRCGGLPQTPRPPLGYRLVFNLAGMFNNYFGRAFVLRNSRVTEIESFSDLESIDLPEPLGRCEAFVTAGATSTCPWTFEGKIQSYNYKTVRYPGHYEKVKLLLDLGLLDPKPVTIRGAEVAPRDLTVQVVGDRIAFPDDRDLAVLRVVCIGEKNGRRTRVQLDLLDFYDEATGFSAMERTTGFFVSIIAIMQARGEIKETGVVPLERSVPTRPFLEALRRRGFSIQETVSPV